MKVRLKITYLLVAALTITACKNQAGSILGSPHSAYVDSLKFKDPDVAGVAAEMDNFMNEELKADKEWASHTASDQEAIVKNFHAEIESLKTKIDSTTKKLFVPFSKLPRKSESLSTPDAIEYFKWLTFLSVEGKKPGRIKNKALQF